MIAVGDMEKNECEKRDTGVFDRRTDAKMARYCAVLTAERQSSEMARTKEFLGAPAAVSRFGKAARLPSHERFLLR
jgi:hypothetical protein